MILVATDSQISFFDTKDSLLLPQIRRFLLVSTDSQIILVPLIILVATDSQISFFDTTDSLLLPQIHRFFVTTDFLIFFLICESVATFLHLISGDYSCL